MNDQPPPPGGLRRQFGSGASWLWTAAAWAGICGLWYALLLTGLAHSDTGSPQRYREWSQFWPPIAQLFFLGWLLALAAYALLRGFRSWRVLDVLIILACILGTFVWVTTAP